MVEPNKAWPNRTVYKWQEVNRGILAFYSEMSGQIVGYVSPNEMLGVYNVYANNRPIGEFISVTSAKTALEDLYNASTLQ